MEKPNGTRKQLAEMRNKMSDVETNEQKYKFPDERVKAFNEWCADHRCDSCPFSKLCGGCDDRTVGIEVMARWLAIPVEEKPLPCDSCSQGGD